MAPAPVRHLSSFSQIWSGLERGKWNLDISPLPPRKLLVESCKENPRMCFSIYYFSYVLLLTEAKNQKKKKNSLCSEVYLYRYLGDTSLGLNREGYRSTRERVQRRKALAPPQQTSCSAQEWTGLTSQPLGWESALCPRKSLMTKRKHAVRSLARLRPFLLPLLLPSLSCRHGRATHWARPLLGALPPLPIRFLGVLSS